MALDRGRFVSRSVGELTATSSQRGYPSRRAMSIGGVGFTPLHLPNLALWFDASDTSSITESSGSVSEWRDKSGFGRHALQANGANQPTTGSATLNGINVISFDGSNDQMTTGAITLTGRQFHLIVAVTGAGQRTPLVSNSVTDTEAVVFQNPSSSPTYRWGGYRASTSFQSTTTSSAANTAYYFVCDFNGSASTLRVNGTQVASGTAGTVNTNAVRLGANPGLSYTAGQLAEVVIVSGNLTSQQVSLWERYAAAKWGF